jgi:medium-chain acyl-[acyl-carrier-protein] hydrolase
MGALVSFELARFLRTQHARSPVHLFVSGRRAPKSPDLDPPIHALSERMFIEELKHFNGTPKETFEHKELLSLVLPILRADFELCETYLYSPAPPLNCPISVFGGDKDPKVSPADLDAWRDETNDYFRLRILPGDHFFLHTAQSLLLRGLCEDLKHSTE